MEDASKIAAQTPVSGQRLTDVAPPDPVKEVRDLKRRVQIGVYGAMLLLIPFYVLVLPLSLYEFLAVYGFSLAIAFAAIEFAFAQMFKLRKQSAYPGVLVIQLGGAQSSAVAYPAGLSILGHLLRLSGSFLCLRQGDSLALVAFNGVSRLQTDDILRLGAADIRAALDQAAPVPFRPASDLASEAVLPAGHTLVFVPVRSLQGVIGVLGLLASTSNRDIRHVQLLNGMGFALGLSLENLRQKEELQELVALDELTGVYNRRYFFEELNREFAFAARYSAPLAVAILDVDGLKEVNDRLGHAAGDEVLRAVALRLVRYSRASDLVARIGGDEFALILPRTDAKAARSLATRLQLAVEQQPVALPDGEDLNAAISCGTASYPADAEDEEALLRRADAVMYCVKAARRQTAKP